MSHSLIEQQWDEVEETDNSENSSICSNDAHFQSNNLNTNGSQSTERGKKTKKKKHKKTEEEKIAKKERKEKKERKRQKKREKYEKELNMTSIVEQETDNDVNDDTANICDDQQSNIIYKSEEVTELMDFDDGQTNHVPSASSSLSSSASRRYEQQQWSKSGPTEPSPMVMQEEDDDDEEEEYHNQDHYQHRQEENENSQDYAEDECDAQLDDEEQEQVTTTIAPSIQAADIIQINKDNTSPLLETLNSSSSREDKSSPSRVMSKLKSMTSSGRRITPVDEFERPSSADSCNSNNSSKSNKGNRRSASVRPAETCIPEATTTEEIRATTAKDIVLSGIEVTKQNTVSTVESFSREGSPNNNNNNTVVNANKTTTRATMHISSNTTITTAADINGGGVVTDYCKLVRATTFLNMIKIAQGSVPKMLCACADSTIHVYGVADGQQYPSLVGHTDRVISLAISNQFYYQGKKDEEEEIINKNSNINDGNRRLKTLVVSGSKDELLRIWDLETVQCLHSIRAHKSPVWAVSIAVRSNGDVIVLSAAENGSMRSWNGKTGKKMVNFKGHTDKVLSLFILNPLGDNPLVFSAGADKTIRVWELLTGVHIRMLEGHEDDVNSVVAGSYAGITSLVPIVHNDDGSVSTPVENNSNTKTIVIVSGSKDCTIKVWDYRSGHLLFELLGHTGCVYCVALIRAPDISKSAHHHNAAGHHASVPPGAPIIVSCSEDSTVRLWNVITGKQIRSEKWHKVSVRGIDVANITLSSSQETTTTAAADAGGSSNSSDSNSGSLTQLPLIASCGWDKTIQLHDLNETLQMKDKSFCTIS